MKTEWLHWTLALSLGAFALSACGDGKKDDEEEEDDFVCFNDAGTPYTIGSASPITGAGGTSIFAKDATPVAVFEINRRCGVLGDAVTGGLPLAITELDTQGSVTTAQAVTQQLVDAGIKMMTGIGANDTTAPNANIAVSNNVLLGTYIGTQDSLSGCSAAQLADPAVTKSPTPSNAANTCWDNHGYHFRLSHRTFDWGRTVVQRGVDVNPTATRAAMMIASNPTGAAVKAGIVARAAAAGFGTMPESGITASPTVAEFKTILETITTNDPQVIFGYVPQQNVRQLAEAYAEMKADTTWAGKPAGFNTVKFYLAPPTYGTDYSNVSAAALAFLASNQMESVGVNFDLAWPGTEAYARILADYDPAKTIESVQTLRNFDMYWLFSLAVTKVGSDADPVALAAAVRDLANGPGEVVYPDEYEKARRIILEGGDIDYEGASGRVEFDDRGDAQGLVYNNVLIQANGTPLWTTTPITVQ